MKKRWGNGLKRSLKNQWICWWITGNVRELRSVIERAMVLHTGNSLHMDPILGKLETTGQPVSLEEVARDHILHVLNDAGWKISGKGGAAEKLGLKESTLRAKMGRLGIRRPG
jgi:transcriptional regulator of acetoin/glycerol metabolism